MSRSQRVELLIGVLLGTALVFAAWSELIPYGLTETLGFVTGAACVYLVIRESVWNFPVGIANNVFFLVLFSQTKLYGDAGLQVVYLVLAAHGWLNWLRGGYDRQALQISRLSRRQWIWLLVSVAVGTVALMEILRAAGGSAPFLDSFTTVLSLAAQVLINFKILENWWLWIVADILYIYLYLTRNLQLTAILYGVFLLLCCIGVWQWRRGSLLNVDSAAQPRGEY